jgi:hypothetical protein
MDLFTNNNAMQNEQLSHPSLHADFVTDDPSPLPLDYTPMPEDVCCGRGKSNWNHLGNLAFRRLIRFYVDAYSSQPTKNGKTETVNCIVQQVRSTGGRFINTHPDGRWYDIGNKQARYKVGHSLRDHVSSMAQHRMKAEKKGKGRGKGKDMSNDKDKNKGELKDQAVMKVDESHDVVLYHARTDIDDYNDAVAMDSYAKSAMYSTIDPLPYSFSTVCASNASSQDVKTQSHRRFSQIWVFLHPTWSRIQLKQFSNGMHFRSHYMPIHQLPQVQPPFYQERLQRECQLALRWH